jgi:ubiquinone/menaquinone biosynthesis C-methylase UbiE
MTAPRNFDLAEEIRLYWSRRAETFDRSPAHGMSSAAEIDAWVALLRDLGLRPGMRVLELGAGTGQFTTALIAAGAEVEAVDFAEPMLARARARHAGGRARFRLADAAAPMVADGVFDAVVCRHLIWTLTEPEATLAAWRRALRPGGLLITIDGDWTRRTPLARLAARIGRAWDARAGRPPLWDAAAHAAIMARLPFGDGLTRERLAALLTACGFEPVAMRGTGRVFRRQLLAAGWRDRLALLAGSAGTYAVAARRTD